MTANFSFKFNTLHDYYIFIDRDDRNKVKARNGSTGDIDFVDTANADVVISAAGNALSQGSSIGTHADATLNLWTGGRYGTILVGPGLYTCRDYHSISKHRYNRLWSLGNTVQADRQSC